MRTRRGEAAGGIKRRKATAGAEVTGTGVGKIDVGRTGLLDDGGMTG